MRKHNTKKILGILLLAILVISIVILQVASLDTSTVEPQAGEAVGEVFVVGDLNYIIT